MFGRSRLGRSSFEGGRHDQVELIEAGQAGSSSTPDAKTFLTSGQPGLSYPAAAAGNGLSAQGFLRRSAVPIMSEQSLVLRGILLCVPLCAPYRGRHSKGLARLGLPKGAFMMYWDDLYHTLLNMPRYRFLASFFTVYLVLYLVFAFFYVGFPYECFGFQSMSFGRAFWFSVWTASTIGYSGDIGPKPTCDALNSMVTFQIMVAALIDTMLMSLVFARFAAPMPRASTIRFSTHVVLARQPGSPFWALTVRLANIRKHSLLDPELTLILAIPKGQGSLAFRFVPLTLEDPFTQVVNLKLGLPAAVTHVVDPSSPLWNMSLATMESQGIEILCFMSGIDPMTSNMLQAQHTWHSSDVRMNEQFVGIQLGTNRMGRVGIDLSEFDSTTTAEGMGFREDSQALLVPVPERGQSHEGVRLHMQELRIRTLASLSGDAYHPRRNSEAGSDTTNGHGTADGQHGASKPQLPMSIHPDLQMAHSGAIVPLGATNVPHVPLTPRTPPAGTWDSSVRALCEAVASDPGTSVLVRQQALALRAAILAVPAAPQPLAPEQVPHSSTIVQQHGSTQALDMLS